MKAKMKVSNSKCVTGMSIGNYIEQVTSVLLALITKYGDTARVIDVIVKEKING